MFTIEVFAVLLVLHLNAVSIQALPKTIHMPAVCEGKTYCTEPPPGYPKRRFEELLSEMNIRSVEPDNELSERIGGDDETAAICKSTKYNFSPIYQIVDQDGFVRYVAQIADKFMQKFNIRECRNPGRVRRSVGRAVFNKEQLNFYNVSCVETKLHQKFLVLSHDQNHVELASPKDGIPVYCSCRYGPV